jgi:hypothetical protein
MHAPPEPKHTPPGQIEQCNTGMHQRAKNCSLCPGRLDRLCLNWPLGGRLDRPKRPACTKLLKNFPNQLEHLPHTPRCPKHAQTSPLVDNAWIKAKCENFQHIASQIYKILHKELHKSKWAS